MAPGSAMPMLAKPLEMMQVFGAMHGYIRAIQSLCAPTSLIRISLSPNTWRRARTTRCGFKGNESPSASARNSFWIISLSAPAPRIVPESPRAEARSAIRGQRLGDGTLDADGYLIRGIHLGRRRIDVHDAFVVARVPPRRRVLHEIVPDANDHIGPIEPARNIIMLLQTDRPQTQRMRVGRDCLSP